MLTGFTWCIPLKTKTAAEVVTAYKNNLLQLWRKCENLDRQWDRVQEQTLQETH